MVRLVCLFMKMHLLVLLQDSCLDLNRGAFLRKLSGYVRNITAFCQHLLKLIKSAKIADTDISVKPIYRSVSNQFTFAGVFARYQHLQCYCENSGFYFRTVLKIHILEKVLIKVGNMVL